jgi:hypothetical protein
MAGCAGCGGPTLVSGHTGQPRKWCSERCRKASYGDPCVDCGGKTRFGAKAARAPQPRCVRCAGVHRTTFDRVTLLARIREWNATYGEPPAVPDWSPRHARVINDVARAERFVNANGHWPYFTTVVRVFGSWNKGLVAAGFEPRAASGGGGNHLRRRSARAAA